MTGVYLELGNKRVFACALDWPGWCRSGRSEAAALEALAAYASRYAPVAELAGLPFAPGAFNILERLPGTRGYTDFGAPGEIASSDYAPLPVAEAERLASLVNAAWTTLDGVVAAAPASLRKGRRGGGRDRDAVVDHTLGAEVAYARKLGVRQRQPAGADRAAVGELRTALLEALRAAADGGPHVPNGWPARYAARRIAWHVLDHAWEIQDRTEVPNP